MPITVFRSRLDETQKDAYLEQALRMNEIAPTMPGYISHKRFIADDGERVTIVEFADEASQLAWANHPEHLEAKKLGPEKYFTDYEIVICEVTRRYFPKKISVRRGQPSPEYWDASDIPP